MAEINVNISEDDLYLHATSDKDSHLYSIHGLDFLCSLYDLDQWLREQIKYNAEGKPEAELEGYEKTREQLREIMDSHNVNLEMMK
jgi:hypothetical protein